MDTADGADAFVLGKRDRGRGRTRQRQRMQIRKMSHRLVKTGQIPEKPCLVCGSQRRNALSVLFSRDGNAEEYYCHCRWWNCLSVLGNPGMRKASSASVGVSVPLYSRSRPASQTLSF